MPNRKTSEEDVEMETHLLLRMPVEPAQAIRKCLKEGGPGLRDRLTVKFEPDMRYGEVRFDNWQMYSRLFDLPTVTETMKTIDNKSFYKSADLCQMLVCKYELDQPTDDESPVKHKKKDPHKVDKKYLWPHGITPPCKNVRKRRFRKTLKKKNVEAPEIEKEVKRLLRTDNEAVNVKWDIVLEEEVEHNKFGSLMTIDENTSQSMMAHDMTGPSESNLSDKLHDLSREIDDKGMPRDIDIFGEDLSSSDDDDDDDDHHVNVDVDDNSRLSDGDSRSNFSSGMHQNSSMATEFNKQMFQSSPNRTRQISDSNDSHQPSSSQYFGDVRFDDDNSGFSLPQMSQDEIHSKIADIQRQLNDLRSQQMQKEQEISSIQNETLRQRMQDNVETILTQMLEKELELEDYQAMLEEK